MRKALLALTVAVMSVGVAAGANAQSTPASEPGEPAQAEPGEAVIPAGTPNITVQEERRVCKRRARTGTRMGTSRVCRTEREWAAAERDLERNAEIAGDTLDVLGADDASTGDQGGLTSGHETPLGPR